ncbi:hypothetical protein [Thiolinea disciformis]|uniref:hypothetical protein n=1 Tax=Thiolinea disciformis TaxID=125614 RepID=UPI00037397A2|nr:hypothetical protein [Thiolinea disciformis]
MTDPQVYDLSASCVAITAPDKKPFAVIVPQTNNKVLVWWSSVPVDVVAIKGQYWTTANATQFAAYDMLLDCATIATGTAQPFANPVSVFAEDVSINAPACVVPGEIWNSPDQPIRGITLSLLKASNSAANGTKYTKLVLVCAKARTVAAPAAILAETVTEKLYRVVEQDAVTGIPVATKFYRQSDNAEVTVGDAAGNYWVDDGCC